MKRGTPRHPKVARLRQLLRKSGLPAAVGYLELLWHFTAEFAPRGDIGRFSDERIEVAMGWTGKPGRLLAALIESRWIDRHRECRLCVHDWQDHADQAVKKRLSRAGLKFVVADPPDGTVPPIIPTVPPIIPTVKQNSLKNVGVSGKVDILPEPEPYLGPEPRVSERKATDIVPRQNIDARAPISGEGAASEDRAGSAVTVLQSAAAPDLFQEFIGVFLAAGKPLNDRDNERALRLWLNYDAPEHARILEHLERSVGDGTWSDARHTPMPASYLDSKAWTRIGPGRVLPKAESKSESAQRRAEARFLRGDR